MSPSVGARGEAAHLSPTVTASWRRSPLRSGASPPAPSSVARPPVSFVHRARRRYPELVPPLPLVRPGPGQAAASTTCRTNHSSAAERVLRAPSAWGRAPAGASLPARTRLRRRWREGADACLRCCRCPTTTLPRRRCPRGSSPHPSRTTPSRGCRLPASSPRSSDDPRSSRRRWDPRRPACRRRLRRNPACS